MKLRRFADPADFLAVAGGFLLAREAEHCLILGIADHLVSRVQHADGDPYLAVAETGSGVAAVALMTPPNDLVLSHIADERALELLAGNLQQRKLRLPGVLGPKPAAVTFAKRWLELNGGNYRLKMAQCIYRLERVIPISGVPGSLRKAASDDRPLVVEWMYRFSEEALGEADTAKAERVAEAYLSGVSRGLYLWEHEGRPVSMAGYSGPTPNGIRVNAVYTPPEQRRRGYAGACVAALSQKLLEEGRTFCFLFTDLANPTSNHIYQAIGYQPVCQVDAYTFETEATADG